MGLDEFRILSTTLNPAYRGCTYTHVHTTTRVFQLSRELGASERAGTRANAHKHCLDARCDDDDGDDDDDGYDGGGPSAAAAAVWMHAATRR